MADGIDGEIQTPGDRDILTKLSQALMQVSRGDPLVALRNEFQTELRSVHTRFAGIDTATKLQHEDMVRVPTDIDRAVGGLRAEMTARMEGALAKVDGKIDTAFAELEGKVDGHIAETKEKFNGVNNQFGSNDKALTAALQAQEKQAIATNDSNTAASTKMEAGFAALIKQGQEFLSEVRKNFEAQIAELRKSSEMQFNDIKSRLDVTQGKTSISDPQLANALSSLGSGMVSMQETMTRSMSKMADTNAEAIRELAKSLRTVEKSEAGAKERGMGRGEIVSYIMMGVLVLSQAVTIYAVLPHK
jgi:hypothetical protein